MKILIVIKKSDVFNPKLYGSVKVLHEVENITKNNLKISLRALRERLQDVNFWENQEFVIKKEFINRSKQKI